MSLGNAGRIAASWAVITVVGVYAFVVSKRSIDSHRTESMLIRQRMRKSNNGEYEPITDRRFV